MAMRIPYPIPEPLRSELMAAGRAAVEANRLERGIDHRNARRDVDKTLFQIFAMYGIEEDEA